MTTAPWVWKHVWPIEDSSMTRTECITVAAPELHNTLAVRRIIPLAAPTWRVVEHDGKTWPETAGLVLIAEVPAVPGIPAPDQWPRLLEWAAGRGWTDRTLASLLGLPESTVAAQRRRAGLPGHAARRAA